MNRTAVLVIVCLFLIGFTCAIVVAAEEPAAPQQVKAKEIRIDRNYDGVADRVEIYDTKGVIARIESDVNSDGKIDEWVYYENNVPVKGEKDLNADGKADTTLIYDAKGAVIRTEADANGDGKIDEWVYYEAGKPVKAEKDTKKDGTPDTWIKY